MPWCKLRPLFCRASILLLGSAYSARPIYPAVLLLAGTKVFVSSLEPLAISTAEVSGILVPRESFKTTKGRPKKIVGAVAAPASVAASVEASGESVMDLSVDGVMGCTPTVDEILSECSMG